LPLFRGVNICVYVLLAALTLSTVQGWLDFYVFNLIRILSGVFLSGAIGSTLIYFEYRLYLLNKSSPMAISYHLATSENLRAPLVYSENSMLVINGFVAIVVFTKFIFNLSITIDDRMNLHPLYPFTSSIGLQIGYFSIWFCMQFLPVACSCILFFEVSMTRQLGHSNTMTATTENLEPLIFTEDSTFVITMSGKH